MMFCWYQFSRLFYYPLFNWVLPLFSKSIKERRNFEKTNLFDPKSKSFYQEGKCADFAFEVSSEGELEQIRPVLEVVLRQNKEVELIFSSESLIGQIEKLLQKYPSNLRVLRLPLLTYFPFSHKRNPKRWLTAKKFYLCRYDFFPELIAYGRQSEIEFFLLSGSLKNYAKYEKNFLLKVYYKNVYKSFTKIVAATNMDKEAFIDKLGIPQEKILAYDFRPVQIMKRQQQALHYLQENFPGFDQFERFINSFPKEKRIIFGSFWENEAALLKGLDSSYLVCIVPHKLGEEHIKEMKAKISLAVPGQNVYELRPHETNASEVLSAISRDPGIVILNIKGVLCELYQLFGHAFVGGGHGISVHSLLEPFLAECMVYCGPKVHRSSEYDLIREKNPDRLCIVEEMKKFPQLLNSKELSQLSDVLNFKNYYNEEYKNVFDRLEIGRGQ